jgi:hypothetical protein
MRGRAADYESKYQQARSLVMSGTMEAKPAAKECGISLYPFLRRLRREDGLDARSQRRGNQKPDPTLEEILQRAEEIRASWTVEETSRRWVGSHSSIHRERATARSWRS